MVHSDLAKIEATPHHFNHCKGQSFYPCYHSERPAEPNKGKVLHVVTSFFLTYKTTVFYTCSTSKRVLSIQSIEVKTFFSVRRNETIYSQYHHGSIQVKAGTGKIRKHGYALDNGENEAEVVSLAAPARDCTGNVVAGISIAGPVYRMTKKGSPKDSFLP